MQMNDILDFMYSHWQLSGPFLFLVVAYLLFEFIQNNGSSQVSPELAIEYFNHQNGVIIDVRPNDSYREGHIVGSIHTDLDESDTKLKRFNKYSKKPVIVVSVDGKSAGQYAERLRTLGLSNVLSLAGGIDAWMSAGLPLTKPSKAK